MRIARIRLVLPPRLRAAAAADARRIAATVAETLAAQGARTAPPCVVVPGLGRPARHLAHDLAVAVRHAARPAAERKA